MPRILSRTDLRPKKGSRHSTSRMSSFPSNSTASYGHNSTWDHPTVSNPLSSPNLIHLSQQARIRAQIGYETRLKDGYNRYYPKGKEQMTQFMSTSPGTVSTTCENFTASESLNTGCSVGGQSANKTGSFLPRMPSSHGDWGQYVDVSESGSPSHSSSSRLKQPNWKKFFH